MKTISVWSLLIASTIFLSACSKEQHPCGKGSGKILDEAKCVGRTPESLKAADEDYFADMDYGISKNPPELVNRLSPYIPGITEEQAVKAIAEGRNNWIVWTAGNDTLWNEVTHASVGNSDLLKIISNHPDKSFKYSRDNRWKYFGIVNEPCYIKGDKPNPDRFGLYLDTRDPGCAKDPFENEQKYPGIEIGARGKTVPVGSYYGYGTGIVGLRLFPNPAFDEAAKANWDPERYYTDPSYYQNKNLIRPYRVGMSCGFCHVGPNPTNPPVDPENPTWANLNSNPGAQYFWIDRVMMFDPHEDSFPTQLFRTSRPGALDTSLISSDSINNPRTMNAIYNLGARVDIATKLGKENLGGGSLNNKQFNQLPNVPAASPLNNFFTAPDTVFTPRVLKDGADSVGALGALNRVYINIGLFSDEWLTHFRPLLGGQKITPFEIDVARKNSSFWVANEQQTPNLALFFLAASTPDYLKNTPQAEQYLSKDEAVLQQGKEVFAETCARCHSSKLPEKTYSFFPENGCVNSTADRNYLKCWNDYWSWTQTDEFKTAMSDIVKQEDFLHNNFLSSELRVPVTLLETNACSPLASNAIKGNIWDNFSSDSYKNLPSVGSINVQHPFTGAVSNFVMPDGGRGYTRPASLVSLWTSAPFLVNNSLGEFYWSGSVDDRMNSFNDSIEKLLWPEKRTGNFTVISKNGLKHPGTIDVTTAPSYLRLPVGFLPDFLQPLTGWLTRIAPWAFGDGGVQLGPIPQGTPVNLLSNIDMEQHGKVLLLATKIKNDLKAIPANASNEEVSATFSHLVEPLLEVSKCPDFVVDKGHYFGTQYLQGDETPLTDEEKHALIEYVKTF
ncbi:MAG: hypothetical protein K0Q67_629 [Cellvibrio sp.]|nr:hypothetical protein [Cellvibrio sp.]